MEVVNTASMSAAASSNQQSSNVSKTMTSAPKSKSFLSSMYDGVFGGSSNKNAKKAPPKMAMEE
jgi:hypothetical protein